MRPRRSTRKQLFRMTFIHLMTLHSHLLLKKTPEGKSPPGYRNTKWCHSTQLHQGDHCVGAAGAAWGAGAAEAGGLAAAGAGAPAATGAAAGAGAGGASPQARI